MVQVLRYQRCLMAGTGHGIREAGGTAQSGSGARAQDLRPAIAEPLNLILETAMPTAAWDWPWRRTTSWTKRWLPIDRQRRPIRPIIGTISNWGRITTLNPNMRKPPCTSVRPWHWPPASRNRTGCWGAVYRSMGRFAEAEAELRAAVQLAETPLLLHSLGVTLMYQRRDREAIPYLRRAVGIAPGRFLWWINLSTALRRSGSIAESKVACKRALRLAEAEMQKNPRDG